MFGVFVPTFTYLYHAAQIMTLLDRAQRHKNKITVLIYATLILSTVIGKKLINQSESSDFHHPATLYLKFVYDMDSKAEFFATKVI